MSNGMIRIFGDEELVRALKRYPNVLDREMRKAALKGAVTVEGEIKKKGFTKGGYRRRMNKRVRDGTRRLRKRTRKTVNTRVTNLISVGIEGDSVSTARSVGRLGRRSVKVPVPPPRWPITYRRTGFASRSLNHDVERGTGADLWLGKVGAWAPYMRRLEEGFHGTDKRGRRYNQKPRRLMRRSLLRRRDDVVDFFRQAPAEARRRVDL